MIRYFSFRGIYNFQGKTFSLLSLNRIFYQLDKVKNDVILIDGIDLYDRKQLLQKLC